MVFRTWDLNFGAFGAWEILGYDFQHGFQDLGSQLWGLDFHTCGFQDWNLKTFRTWFSGCGISILGPRFNSPAEPAWTVGFGKRDSARDSENGILMMIKPAYIFYGRTGSAGELKCRGRFSSPTLLFLLLRHSEPVICEADSTTPLCVRHPILHVGYPGFPFRARMS